MRRQWVVRGPTFFAALRARPPRTSTSKSFLKPGPPLLLVGIVVDGLMGVTAVTLTRLFHSPATGWVGELAPPLAACSLVFILRALVTLHWPARLALDLVLTSRQLWTQKLVALQKVATDDCEVWNWAKLFGSEQPLRYLTRGRVLRSQLASLRLQSSTREAGHAGARLFGRLRQQMLDVQNTLRDWQTTTEHRRVKAAEVKRITYHLSGNTNAPIRSPPTWLGLSGWGWVLLLQVGLVGIVWVCTAIWHSAVPLEQPPDVLWIFQTPVRGRVCIHPGMSAVFIEVALYSLPSGIAGLLGGDINLGVFGSCVLALSTAFTWVGRKLVVLHYRRHRRHTSFSAAVRTQLLRLRSVSRGDLEHVTLLQSLSGMNGDLGRERVLPPVCLQPRTAPPRVGTARTGGMPAPGIATDPETAPGASTADTSVWQHQGIVNIDHTCWAAAVIQCLRAASPDLVIALKLRHAEQGTGSQVISALGALMCSLDENEPSIGIRHQLMDQVVSSYETHSSNFKRGAPHDPAKFTNWLYSHFASVSPFTVGGLFVPFALIRPARQDRCAQIQTWGPVHCDQQFRAVTTLLLPQVTPARIITVQQLLDSHCGAATVIDPNTAPGKGKRKVPVHDQTRRLIWSDAKPPRQLIFAIQEEEGSAPGLLVAHADARVTVIDKDHKTSLYELAAVIVRRAPSATTPLAEGHMVAYVAQPSPEPWLLCDDEQVTEVEVHVVTAVHVYMAYYNLIPLPRPIPPPQVPASPVPPAPVAPVVPKVPREPLPAELTARRTRVASIEATGRANNFGRMGIHGGSNSCYINGVVQCIASCSKLTDYFIRQRYYRQGVATAPLLEELGALLAAVQRRDHQALRATSFKKAIGGIKRIYSNGQQQDGQEFLSDLLDAVHGVLNTKLPRRDPPALATAGLSDQMAAEAAWIDGRLDHDSFILDTLQGQYRSTLTCRHCNSRSTKFDAFTVLSLPIPANTLFLPNRQTTLTECLAKLSATELVADAKCGHCKITGGVSKSLCIWRLPSLLIIHLKRFEPRRKIFTPVVYPRSDLAMQPYVQGPQGPSGVYDLQATLNHSGGLHGGHYTAHPYCAATRVGLCCDDDRVAMEQQASINPIDAYVLIYQCRSPPGPAPGAPPPPPPPPPAAAAAARQDGNELTGATGTANPTLAPPASRTVPPPPIPSLTMPSAPTAAAEPSQQGSPLTPISRRATGTTSSTIPPAQRDPPPHVPDTSKARTQPAGTKKHKKRKQQRQAKAVTAKQDVKPAEPADNTGTANLALAPPAPATELPITIPPLNPPPAPAAAPVGKRRRRGAGAAPPQETPACFKRKTPAPSGHHWREDATKLLQAIGS